MTYRTKKELVENLLRRRFGSLAPPPVTTLHMANPRPKNDHIILAPMNQARLDLEAMTPTQLEEIVRTEDQKDLEALRAKEAAEELNLFFHQASANADFAFWAKMPIWTLDEAISLSLGKDPRVVNWDSVNGGGEQYVLAALIKSLFPKDYAQRRELVRRALSVRDLVDPIRPEVYLVWAQSTFDSVPTELVEQVRARGKHMADMHALTVRVAELEAQLATNGTVTNDGWPWGGYETKLLRKLAAAAQRYWVNYDPSAPDTAATNQTVSDWLQSEQEVSDRVAEIMAQILRADGLRPGPRK